ncbi:MAG: transglycosylase SLT domain-containing protein [Bacteroidales bacterium]|nr:transglycosylase SLT domain-containing protein [Bacteroidales bacterium]
MNSHQALIAIVLLALPMGGWGKPNPTIGANRHRGSGCGIIQNLDSLKHLTTPFTTPGTSSDVPYPTFPDLVYEVRIAAIDNLSPIAFDYNEHVKRYIDIYSLERRDQVSQMLGLAQLYFPLFDELLDKYQLPLELKYLAVVESALNPLAVSTSGAVGLWQFKINTGRMFDLEVNSYIDERMDPVKSTEAACLYLKYLYRIFNDWHLVMAAYNAGPGVVRNAIFRSGGETNFWKLFDNLPEAAQNYVPAFIAAAYIMQNANEHGINAATPTAQYMETDTVIVRKPLTLGAISQHTDIPIDFLRFLNPIYRRGVVPESEKGYAIRLPVSKIQSYLEHEQIILNSIPSNLTFHDILSKAGSTENRIRVWHSVLPGDHLHKIAVRYNCTIDDINIWNPNLSSDLAIGQQITLWVDKQTYDLIQISTLGF